MHKLLSLDKINLYRCHLRVWSLNRFQNFFVIKIFIYLTFRWDGTEPVQTGPDRSSWIYYVSLSTGNVLKPVVSDLFSWFDIFWIYNKNPNHETGPNRSRNKNPDFLVRDDMFLDRFGPVWIGMDWMDHHTNYIPIKYRIIQYSMSTQLISSPATIRSLPVLDGMLLDRSGPVSTGWDHTLIRIIIDDDYTQNLGV